MPKVIYTGHRALTYSQYMDLDTGKILAVVPGGTYDIQATAYNAPAYPADGFTLVQDEEAEEEELGENEDPITASELEE